MGNHQRMNRDELLKKLYYDFKNPADYAGKFKLFHEVKKRESNISIEDVKEWLKLQLAYDLHKLIRLNFIARLVVVHQWQIGLVHLNKLSKISNGFKFIKIRIDILSKYAWLESLRSKDGITIKNVLEHVFSQSMRRLRIK